MLYPNKEEAMGYRVQDKIFKVNEYFPFSKHGDDAHEKAKTRQGQLDQNRKFRNMRINLDINQIFKKTGEVIGLKRTTKVKNGKTVDVLFLQIGVDGKQKKTDISLENKTFDEGYKKIQEKILEWRGLEKNHELTMLFKKTAPIYRHPTLESNIKATVDNYSFG